IGTGSCPALTGRLHRSSTRAARFDHRNMPGLRESHLIISGSQQRALLQAAQRTVGWAHAQFPRLKETLVNSVTRVILLACILLTAPRVGAADDQWLVLEGKEGPGLGKHIVLVSGDEEYRSEEALPQLAHILSKHHGFKCTVLFAIDPKDGTINPN